MPRPRKVIRSIPKNIMLPEDVVAKMELHLFSELEGRIPQGAQAELITKLLREYFADLERSNPNAN